MENVKLNFAHLCDSAFLSQSGKMNIIGDFDKISAKKVLDTDKIFHSFFVVTNFTVTAIGEYTQKISIKNKEDNSEIFGKEKARKVDRVGKVGFIGNFGVIFPGHGEYSVEIYINDVLIINLPLTIIETN